MPGTADDEVEDTWFCSKDDTGRTAAAPPMSYPSSRRVSRMNISSCLGFSVNAAGTEKALYEGGATEGSTILDSST
jgi:hypothetical protein